MHRSPILVFEDHPQKKNLSVFHQTASFPSIFPADFNVVWYIPGKGFIQLPSRYPTHKSHVSFKSYCHEPKDLVFVCTLYLHH